MARGRPGHLRLGPHRHLLTGYAGYFVIDRIWPSFYDAPIKEGKNVWPLLQLACMVMYMIGVILASRDVTLLGHKLA